MAEKDREVDILINNAGISMRVDFISNAFENDKIMINTNYLSHVAMTKVPHFIPCMIIIIGGPPQYAQEKIRTYCLY